MIIDSSKGHFPLMVNFLRDNSYHIFKMFVNQLGMTMFGLALSMATAQNDTFFFASSIFAVIFYLVLLYTMTWDIGYGEKIRIDAKRLDYKPLKGLVISFCANIVNIVLGILITVGYYGASAYSVSEAGIRFPSAPDSMVNVFGTAKTIATILEGMYAGIINRFFLNSPWIYIVIAIPAMLTCTVAYIMGVKGKRLTRFGGPTESKE